MRYLEHFEEHYKNWFNDMHIKQLVQCEKDLSAFIDSDFYESFILGDEVETLYQIICDECIRRLHKFAETDLSIL